MKRGSMKLIFTSDIHKNKKVIDYILNNYEADCYYDCGDSELLNYDLKNFYTVLGNCDYESYPNYRVVNIDENLNIFITHGHLYSLNTMISMAKQRSCNVIVHGHTHIKKQETIDDVLILNPGSVTKPRSKESNTFLIINYNELLKEISLEFVKINL